MKWNLKSSKLFVLSNNFGEIPFGFHFVCCLCVHYFFRFEYICVCVYGFFLLFFLAFGALLYLQKMFAWIFIMALEKFWVTKKNVISSSATNSGLKRMPQELFHKMGVLFIRHSSRSFVLYLIFFSPALFAYAFVIIFFLLAFYFSFFFINVLRKEWRKLLFL